MALKAQNNQKMMSLIPAEWDRQAVMWTAWPSHPELWEDNLEPARAQIAQMIHAIAEGQKVKVLAMGAAHVENAKNALGSSAEVFDAQFGDIWLRDTGPIFSNDGRALCFKTNGWGGKYQLPYDDMVGKFVAKKSGAKIQNFNFILEGGALEHNGQGIILTTRQCVLNPNRNNWTGAHAESLLKCTFGANRIVWLDEGLMNDHTDGHIDNLARFVSENTLICQSAFGDDDPNADLYGKIAEKLKSKGFEVVQVPSPGLYKNDEGEVVPASHMNFIIANSCVVVPTYGSQSADQAVAMIAELFPGRKVIGVDSSAVLTGGGSFHCITQQEPKINGASV